MKPAIESERKTVPSLPAIVAVGREICGDLRASEHREWLVTNGLGGFASGTVAGLLTRRYHGLLIAAPDPPASRTLLVNKVDETIDYRGYRFELGTNRWADRTVAPQGFQHVEGFRLHGTIPVWTFNCADALLEKSIWMQEGRNTSYVRYNAVRAAAPLHLSIKVLVNYRDYHSVTHAGDWHMDVSAVDGGVSVKAFDAAQPFFLRSDGARAEPAHDWYRACDLARERERGLEADDDVLHAVTFYYSIEEGKSLTLVFSTRPDAPLDGQESYRMRLQADSHALECWSTQHPRLKQSPPQISQLVLAAQQFLIERPDSEGMRSQSIIAGYPWFTDWGRDTMIALPGLTLSTGQPDRARSVLQTFSKYVRAGMLPNYFPGGSAPPEYNSVDASLWYIEAVRHYHAATADTASLESWFPVLQQIVQSYEEGTRFNIHADRGDGLLSAGEAGVQLTWMDARVGDWVITPRAGKPIEVNALWLNALASMGDFAESLGKPAGRYRELRKLVSSSFARFWNDQLQYCFDVLDGPDGDDDTLRPNQIFAVSLPQSGLTTAQQRAVVDMCALHLLTPYGLRTLKPDSAHYHGRYTGSCLDRDSAYHQGTAWGWLLGPFALAHFRAYQNRERALLFLAPLALQVSSYGMGTAGEIFEADPPFMPRGCIAQAWTVGELLRAWSTLSD